MEEEKPIIGTLAEKNVHATLKRLIEPDETKHEQRFHRYVADILTEDRVFEIQTRQFYRLRAKLSVFLSEKEVTLVYPIPHKRFIQWIDPETGELSPKRRSPKTGTFMEVFRELTGITEFLTHPRFTLRLYLMDMDEYRFLDGWSRDRKRGSHRAERIPTSVFAVTELKTPEDYAALLPDTLPDPFTVKELAKYARISEHCAGNAARCLRQIGAIAQEGKRGRAFLYRITASSRSAQ